MVDSESPHLSLTMTLQESGPEKQLVLPLFFRNKDVLGEKLTTLEICRAAEKTVGAGNIEGAQIIKGLWRLYCKNQQTRVELLQKKLTLRNITIDLYDQNPYVKPESDSTYLVIHNIPLSYSNDVIANWLDTHGLKPVSEVKYHFVRDESGKLTNYKTGSRFVYVKADPDKIPEKAQIGLFWAKLWYPGLKKTVTKVSKCSNCLQSGHVKKDCQAEVVCLACRQAGHKKGECPMPTPETDEGWAEPPPSMVIDQPAATAEAPQETAPHSPDDDLVPDEVVQRVADLILKKTQMQTRRGTITPRGTPTTARAKRHLSDASNGASTKKKDERQTPEQPSQGEAYEWPAEEWGDANSGQQMNHDLESQDTDSND